MQVEAIVTLLLQELFQADPDDPYAHAVRYLRDPGTRDQVAGFTRSEDCLARDLLDQDEKIYGDDDTLVETRSQRMTKLYGLIDESSESPPSETL